MEDREKRQKRFIYLTNTGARVETDWFVKTSAYRSRPQGGFKVYNFDTGKWTVFRDALRVLTTEYRWLSLPRHRNAMSGRPGYESLALDVDMIS
jgi:hypothetical protein